MPGATYRLSPHRTVTVTSASAESQTRPALRTREYFAGMDAALARGGSVLDHAPVFRAHAAEVRLVGRGIQAPLLAVLAGIGGAVRRPYRGAP